MLNPVVRVRFSGRPNPELRIRARNRTSFAFRNKRNMRNWLIVTVAAIDQKLTLGELHELHAVVSRSIPT